MYSCYIIPLMTALLAALGLLTTFFWPIFLQGKTFFAGDNLIAILPNKIFTIETLKQGVLPFWNPNLWNGQNFLADTTVAVFSPFNLVYFLLPNLVGSTLCALLSYFLSFLGTFLFLKKEKMSKLPALIGATVFTFSGSMINLSLDINRLNVICFLPWILLGYRNKNFFLTILLSALSILSGNFQFFYMAQFFIFGYLLFTSDKKSLFKNICFFGLTLFLSLALTFFQTWPQIKLIKYTSRAQSSLAYTTTWSLHPASFLRFFLADFWGRRNEGSFWGPLSINSSSGYIGFFPLIFIISWFLDFKKNNLFKLKNLFENKNTAFRKIFFLALAAFFCLIASLGKFNPGYKAFLLIPGFSLFRSPISWLIIYSFSLACLTAFLLQKQNLDKNSSFKKIVSFVSFSFILFGFLGLITASFFPFVPFESLTLFRQSLGKGPSFFHSLEIDQQLCFLISRNLLILGVLSLILLKKYQLKTLFLVIFLDLFFLAKGELSLAPKILHQHFKNFPQTPQVNFLKDRLDSWRFVSTAEFLPYRGINNYFDNYFRLPPFIPQSKWRLNKQELKDLTIFKNEMALLPPNLNMILDLASINGYSTFIFKDYLQFWQKDSEKITNLTLWLKKVKDQQVIEVDPVSIDFDYIFLDDPRLSLLSVKYILAWEKLDLPSFEEIKFPDGFYIYQNPKALPRAYLIDQEEKITKGAEVEEINPNQVLVSLKDFNPQQDKKLILTDHYYPSWQAFDNKGKNLAINQYKGVFRAVDLKPETQTVTFKFIPEDFYFGLKVSAVFLFAFLPISLRSFFSLSGLVKKKANFWPVIQNKKRNKKQDKKENDL